MEDALAGRSVEGAYGRADGLPSGIEVAAGNSFVRTLDRRLCRALYGAVAQAPLYGLPVSLRGGPCSQDSSFNEKAARIMIAAGLKAVQRGMAPCQLSKKGQSLLNGGDRVLCNLFDRKRAVDHHETLRFGARKLQKAIPNSFMEVQ